MLPAREHMAQGGRPRAPAMGAIPAFHDARTSLWSIPAAAGGFGLDLTPALEVTEISVHPRPGRPVRAASTRGTRRYFGWNRH